VATRATSRGTAAAPLRCLLTDEARFIDAAFDRFFPEARGEGLRVSASAYVDAKLAAHPMPGNVDLGAALPFYRSAIAEVQAHCVRTLGRRFQALPVWQQLAVIAQLERAADAASDPKGCLIERLLNDAAEAYFAAAAKSLPAATDVRDIVAA